MADQAAVQFPKKCSHLSPGCQPMIEGATEHEPWKAGLFRAEGENGCLAAVEERFKCEDPCIGQVRDGKGGAGHILCRESICGVFDEQFLDFGGHLGEG